MINQRLPEVLKNYILRNGTKKYKFWNDFLVGKCRIKNTNEEEETVTNDVFKQITKFKKAFDNTYDKENWGFSFEYYSGVIRLTGILVYFPVLDITNSSSGRTHFKKDVYLFFKLKVDRDFNDGDVKIEAPKLFSTTINEIENLASGADNHLAPKFYFHSHFIPYRSESSLVDYMNSHTFCYGGGDSGNMVSSVFLKEQPQDFIEFYLHTVNEFIKIESEDGGPYMRIRNLKDKRASTSSRGNITQSKNNVRQIYSSFIESNLKVFVKLLKFCDFSVDELTVKVKTPYDFDLQVLDLLEREEENIEGAERIQFYKQNSASYLSLSNFVSVVEPSILRAQEESSGESETLVDYYDFPFIFETKEDQLKYKRTSNIALTENPYPEYGHLTRNDFVIDTELLIKLIKKFLDGKIKKRNKAYIPTRSAYVK